MLLFDPKGTIGEARALRHHLSLRTCADRRCSHFCYGPLVYSKIQSLQPISDLPAEMKLFRHDRLGDVADSPCHRHGPRNFVLERHPQPGSSQADPHRGCVPGLEMADHHIRYGKKYLIRPANQIATDSNFRLSIQLAESALLPIGIINLPTKKRR